MLDLHFFTAVLFYKTLFFIFLILILIFLPFYFIIVKLLNFLVRTVHDRKILKNQHYTNVSIMI